jgi:hypothetical protein
MLLRGKSSWNVLKGEFNSGSRGLLDHSKSIGAFDGAEEEGEEPEGLSVEELQSDAHTGVTSLMGREVHSNVMGASRSDLGLRDINSPDNRDLFEVECRW